jgi:para-aminobenzoate synthetase component 1
MIEIADKRALRPGPILTPNRVNEKGVIILESTLTGNGLGTKSFFCRRPVASVRSHGAFAEIAFDGQKEYPSCKSVADIFNIIEDLSTRICGEPFAAGYVDYEFACRSLFDRENTRSAEMIPGYLFNLYRSVLIYDHRRDIYRITDPDADNYADALLFDEHRRQVSGMCGGSAPAIFRPSIGKSDYINKVNQIKSHITEGDIYQVNLTNRFTAKTDMPGYGCYRRLRRLNPAPYSAYLNFGDFEIISSSPERLITKAGERIETRPIKGTRPRGKNKREDERLKSELSHSEKDRAELLMITDLSRNDLGMVAQTGSVTVSALHQLETYSSLHHLVSYIVARLDSSKSISDLMEAVLPGGSITGAPKKRAVEILLDIEPVPRMVYTGSIGWIHKGDLDFNIAIRTILKTGDIYMVNAGGGIVADSDANEEYAEIITKARNLFAAVSDNFEVDDD